MISTGFIIASLKLTIGYSKHLMNDCILPFCLNNIRNLVNDDEQAQSLLLHSWIDSNKKLPASTEESQGSKFLAS